MTPKINYNIGNIADESNPLIANVEFAPNTLNGNHQIESETACPDCDAYETDDLIFKSYVRPDNPFNPRRRNPRRIGNRPQIDNGIACDHIHTTARAASDCLDDRIGEYGRNGDLVEIVDGIAYYLDGTPDTAPHKLDRTARDGRYRDPRNDAAYAAEMHHNYHQAQMRALENGKRI